MVSFKQSPEQNFKLKPLNKFFGIKTSGQNTNVETIGFEATDRNPAIETYQSKPPSKTPPIEILKHLRSRPWKSSDRDFCLNKSHSDQDLGHLRTRTPLLETPIETLGQYYLAPLRMKPVQRSTSNRV